MIRSFVLIAKKKKHLNGSPEVRIKCPTKMFYNSGQLYNGLDSWTKRKPFVDRETVKYLLCQLWQLLENYEENIKNYVLQKEKDYQLCHQIITHGIQPVLAILKISWCKAQKIACTFL